MIRGWRSIGGCLVQGYSGVSVIEGCVGRVKEGCVGRVEGGDHSASYRCQPWLAVEFES